MRNGLVGGVVGAVLVGIVGYLAVGRPPTDGLADTEERLTRLEAGVKALAAAKPRSAVITLKKGATAQCDAEIDVPQMGGYPEQPVRWEVIDDSENPCRPRGNWAVWLVFDASDFPFQQANERLGRNGRTIPIKGNATIKTHTYKVWMRGQTGGDYELIDPDLEVEAPPF